MAECVRERPRASKTKPQKSKEKREADAGKQTVPGPDSVSGMQATSLSHPQQAGDLETDSAEDLHVPDFAALPAELGKNDSLQSDQHEVGQLSGMETASACSGDVLAASSAGENLIQGAVAENVATADLLHLDEDVSQDTTQTSEGLHVHNSLLSPLLPVLSDKYHLPQDVESETDAALTRDIADGANDGVQVSTDEKTPSSAAAIVPEVLDTGLPTVTAALAPPPSLESAQKPPSSAAVIVSEVLDTALPTVTAASVPAPSLESAKNPPSAAAAIVSEVLDAGLPTVTAASAPPPSLESAKPELLPLSEHAASAPLMSLPLVPQVPAPIEALPPPSAPPTQPSACVDAPSTEVKTLAERMPSPTTCHALYPTVPELESPVEGKFQPMSLEQLQQLYYNPQLQANAQFVDEFVQKEEKKTTHEFHDILMNYFRARKSLLGVEGDLKAMRQNYDQILMEMWVIHKCNIKVEGQCGHNSKVSKVHTVEQCKLNDDALKNMKKTLQSICNEMQGDLALFAYSSQMSRIQVESYLHLLFSGSPLLRDMPRNAPVVAMDHTREELLPQVEKLKACISVLFGFHRRPTNDKEFIDNIRKWTDRLVAALLRLASLSDHLFLLNHVLRAPYGVGKWACGYLQIPRPVSLSVQTTLGSPVLDHVVTSLATVLLPIKAREQFMCHMRPSVTELSLQMDQTWTFLDYDGDEDDPTHAWLYLNENDVVTILDQFPWHAIYTHLLQAPVTESGVVQYDVRRCTEPSMMKLFAFCTTWTSLLGQGLNTYSLPRYAHLNRTLGNIISNTIAFVSDHWLNFKTYYTPLASAASLDHLQLEFDQLFLRVAHTILTARKLGSWQFMAHMPFTSLSSGSIWRLLWLLQQVHGQPLQLHLLPPVDKCKEDMKDIESRRQLADTLQALPSIESTYLLTTFSQMATARPLEESEFIECVTLQLFEIAFICDHTSEFCEKLGRTLLSSIIQKHPSALSILLRRVQEVMEEVGKSSLSLFCNMPASIWIPQDPDMLLLRQWLLTNDLHTTENQLARVVIERMNWDLFSETGKLVLDIRLHRQVALLLIESYVKFIADRRASYYIIESMKQMASYAYTGQGSREQHFSNWAWAMSLRLKLHREAAILHSRAAESHPFHAPVLEEEQWLIPLASAARAKSPLACFLVLSMTDVGHDTSQFISVGLDMLMTLAMSSQYSAVIHVLSCVTPQFISCPQYLLENEIFHKILQMVLSADESVVKVTKMAMGAEFKAGTITQQFTQMIQAMVSARLGHSEALPALLFWVQAVFKVAHFLTDMNSCYVLDHLVRWGYLQKGARDKLDEVFRHYHKQLQAESKPRGGFLTWVGGGPVSGPSLMESASMPEFGWLATQVLSVEDALDQECGVWPAVQQELLNNPQLSPDTALKHVVTRLKPEYPRSASRLCIYRWAQQALDMPINQPMMPIVWQKFFSLYLGRCAQQAQMPARASVGERFFQSMTMSSMQKRMKKKLVEATKFHLNYEPQEDTGKETDEPSPGTSSRRGSNTDSPVHTEESAQYFSSKDFHNQLARLYQTFSLWLEEPRLLGAELYLPSLPPQYEAARLMHVFTPGNSPWLEFVDFEGAQYDISLFAAQWRKIVSGQPQFVSHSPTRDSQSPTHQFNTLPATQRILTRLQRFDLPQPAPSLQTVSPPVPDISPALMTDKQAAIHLLDSDLAVLADFTKSFSTRAAQHCAINLAFLDLIPEHWRNVSKVVEVKIECRGLLSPFHHCDKPALVPVRIEEREVNSVVQRKMDENRAEYKQLIIETVLPPPQNVCIATVHVENAITVLIKLSQSTSDPEKRAVLNDVACTLFFHLTMQVCEETNFYPPTKQFFASCVEILGQEFVSRSPSQTPLLMQFCLDNPDLAGMVAPHFVPNNAPQNFVSMYGQLITTLQQQNLNLVFMLLTKFDVWAWLEKIQPHGDDKKRFLEILGSALISCGAEPSSDSKLVFDLYVSHLRSVLKYQFPANMFSVLSLLLQGSSHEGLHTSVWEMFLMECCAASQPGTEGHPGTHVFSVPHVQACCSIPFSTQQLQEVLKYLGAFFNYERRNHQDLMNFGLYPRWGRYVPYLSLLLGLLSRSFVAKVLAPVDSLNPYEEVQIVWYQQLDLWHAWMEPLPYNMPPAGMVPPAGMTAPVPHNVDMMQPWTEGDSTVAVNMVESFKSTLMFTHATLANASPQFSSSVFSMLLMHYLMKLSHRSTPPHVTDVLVGEFSQLPWEQLKPDLKLLETMAHLKEYCAPNCFQLIGHIMPKVKWTEVIAGSKAHSDPQSGCRVQAALLILLVQCYGDPSVKEIPEVAHLLTCSERFDWSGLTVDAYGTASYWFLQVCQPLCVLAQRSSLPALGFRLMKAAAEFTPAGSQVLTKEMSMKRLTYLHCVVQQMVQVTYLANTDLEALSTVLVNLLSEVESVESAVMDVTCQEEESLDLMKEVLSLLNNSNRDGPSQGVLLQTLRQWLHSSPRSILLTPCIKATSRILASLAQVVQITETCIQVYFTAYTKDKEESAAPVTQPVGSAWGHILAVFQVPELSFGEYVQEALNSGSYLLLYALLLHKRPLCQAMTDEAGLMEDILVWTTRSVPTSENEAKLLLWWLEFCRMWLHQLDSGASAPLCIIAIQRLIDLLRHLGEDRDATGFLGFIGLGKRSLLSPQFRLAVRSMAAFLSSQVLSETTLRFQSTSPLSDKPKAKECRSALASLRGNKTYAALKEPVESMIGFVHRTDHTARSVLELIKELSFTLYPECDYLKVSIMQGDA